MLNRKDSYLMTQMASYEENGRQKEHGVSAGIFRSDYIADTRY